MPTREERSPEIMEWLTLPSDPESLEEFRAFVLPRAQKFLIPVAKLPVLELALEEILLNVISYAYDGNPGLIRVGCGADNTRFVVSFRDDGKYFNPLEREEVSVDAPIDDRPVGGLGIHLVKNMVDEISYRRVDESNVLEVAFTFGS